MADTVSTIDHSTNLVAGSLLSTKLFIPQARQLQDILPRPRLVERLKTGLSRKLTLISTPVGFGKTTLLTEWIPQSERCVSWVSLDENDNDLTRFLTYFIAALQMLKSDFGQTLLVTLQSPQPPAIESLITALVNEIIRTLDKFALVLDDYHLIHLPAIHAAVAFLLSNLPPNMHLIITSRADPSLPLARLRVRGQLTELRAADLRFTPNEAAAFLNEIMGLSLSTEDITVLETHTEGWIAGLQLAALSMQGRHDLTRFIQTFTGSHIYVVDYLTEEVLQRQPESMQTFLLQTSILERLSGSLCNAITEESDGQAMLEQLQQHNLFIIPLDDERHWYRYHHLFSELLRARLARTHPDCVPELHRRASSWYEHNGLMAEAVQHALAAGDGTLAARLIEPLARPMQLRGEMMTVMGWLAALPEDELRARPRLGLIYAWGLATTGQLLVAERWLQNMEHDLTAFGDRDNLLGEVTVILARIALIQGEFPRAIELARQALASLAEDQLSLRALNYVSLGSACIGFGDLDTASQSFAQAIGLYQAIGQPVQALLPLRQLARVQLQQGHLNQLDQAIQEALRLAAEWGKSSPLMGYTYMSLGELWYERNDLTAASRYFIDGLALVELGGTREVLNLMNLVDAHLGLARLKQTHGDLQSALDLIRRIEPIWGQLAHVIQQRSSAQSVAPSERQVEPGRSRPGVSQIYLDLIAACQVRLWLSQGDLDAATQWAQNREWSLEGEIMFVEEIRHITLVRVLIAQGEHERALALLARLLDATEAMGRMGRVIELLALQALALHAQGRESEALIRLERALVLAEPEGYIRTFVDEGPPMAALLREAHTRGIMPAYVAKLLAAFPTDESGTLRVKYEEHSAPLHLSSRFAIPQPLVEPLSKRELEILSLIAQGLTNFEIAQQIFISAQTVKVHTRNIYGKLGVNCRRQAVSKARTLGLLT
ncbi:MAG: helix-turn-helix transcriptional regulator [Anaerolineales bacterium]|nr:helix-turn-helix transcriptional regulator [Anaerolineales bacterium]